MTPKELNESHAIDQSVQFLTGEGGLTCIQINNPHATAELTLFGGQVLQFTPVGNKPLLWTSPIAVLDGTKAIRGGIPICWPWFMAHSTETKFPSHGFARISDWEFVNAQTKDDQSTLIELQLKSNDDTRQFFPHDFRLTVSVCVGTKLSKTLRIENTGADPFTFAAALHSYFAVSHIDQTSCDGLQGVSFIDNLDGKTVKREDDPFGFSSETERVYIDSPETIRLQDGERVVTIEKSGSSSTIVWNPWIEKAKSTSDCTDDGYKQFVCVESANVDADARTVLPGHSHEICQRIGVDPLS